MQKRVLVVDDNQIIHLIVRWDSEMHTPFIVHEACDGIDAAEKAGALHPDLVVMDLYMPRMRRLDAARQLKNHRPPAQVVLFTIHKSVVPDSDADQAGLDAIVSKSDGVEPLVQQVQNLLERTH